MSVYDLIIIGAGPAGITAAVYAARKKMSILVISPDIGGQAAWSGDIENYTGYQFISGPDLASKFEEHMRKYNIALKEGEMAIDLKKLVDTSLVKTDKGEYRAKAVIVASGKKSRELRVPGEKEFKNRGLTYCATCDGPLFSGKDVAIIGGGNSALDAALQMVKIAKKIYVINNTPRLGGDPVMREKVEKDPIVTVFNESRVTAVLGDKFVNAVKIAVSGEERTVSVQGIFVEIGLIPNTDFAKDLAKNEVGEIKVNSRNETNIQGIFAAGDVTDVPEKQIIIAAGEGSKACLSAFRYLSEH
ncbi:MAG: FAD-dependent oxidoreductase [Candidatus Omnitrophica bacterium]|nr:FAD-dependent oxidoreductase [Candidatus Omnitrophota bacterium]MDD5311227.1 FAD-dependent oxidoreductase [Candidatus Omnitrophota bacterium]MDD5545740.1 FAD-dependent oxidoreductase [Candidatus Omnitrophota bacterium]